MPRSTPSPKSPSTPLFRSLHRGTPNGAPGRPPSVLADERVDQTCPAYFLGTAPPIPLVVIPFTLSEAEGSEAVLWPTRDLLFLGFGWLKCSAAAFSAASSLLVCLSAGLRPTVLSSPGRGTACCARHLCLASPPPLASTLSFRAKRGMCFFFSFCRAKARSARPACLASHSPSDSAPVPRGLPPFSPLRSEPETATGPTRSRPVEAQGFSPAKKTRREAPIHCAASPAASIRASSSRTLLRWPQQSLRRNLPLFRFVLT